MTSANDRISELELELQTLRDREMTLAENLEKSNEECKAHLLMRLVTQTKTVEWMRNLVDDCMQCAKHLAQKNSEM